MPVPSAVIVTVSTRMFLAWTFFAGRLFFPLVSFLLTLLFFLLGVFVFITGNAPGVGLNRKRTKNAHELFSCSCLN